jgi:hypothetical protein
MGFGTHQLDQGMLPFAEAGDRRLKRKAKETAISSPLLKHFILEKRGMFSLPEHPCSHAIYAAW